MNEHTPGPWHTKITDDGELWLVISENLEIYLGDLEETDKERHTNARLMSAAPEMLAACRAALLVLPYRYQKENELLRQAIAKATGLTPGG